MGIFATLLPQPVHVQRIRSAIRDRHELYECADWVALVRTCDREPVRVAVVDLYWEQAPDFGEIRQLKQHVPLLTLIAYVDMALDRAHDVFDAGRMGVDGLILSGLDDSPATLNDVIERSESRSLAGLVHRTLDGIDPMVVDAAALAVTRAHQRLPPEALARLLAQPYRTVALRLSAEGFPPPQRLLTWGRLIVAAHMLQDRLLSADRVASSLDFPSGSAFRNSCQRYLHATPSQVRSRGGAEYVLRALLRQVHSRLSIAHEPRSRASMHSSALVV